MRNLGYSSFSGWNHASSSSKFNPSVGYLRFKETMEHSAKNILAYLFGKSIRFLAQGTQLSAPLQIQNITYITVASVEHIQ